MFFVLVLLSVFVLLSTLVIWATYGWRKTSFLPEFAGLLEHPEFVDGFSDTVGVRSCLRGEFRGRTVVILLHRGNEEASPSLVVAIQTHAAVTMDTYDFADYRADRDAEVAVYALEVKHELMLRHMDGYLKAHLGFLPGFFDRSKWQSVLEAMATLADSVEQRGSSPTPAAGR